ncbi:MAG: hypothetical protein RL701_3966 [Pseudomonadota bacterium]
MQLDEKPPLTPQAALTLLQQIGTSACSATLDGQLCAANAGWCQLFGLDQAALAFCSLAAALRLADEVCVALAARAATGAVVAIEHNLGAEQHAARWVKTTFARVLETEGVSWLLISSHNVDREVERAQALSAASQELSSVLLESVTDAVIAFDRDWRYTFLNTAAEEFLSLPRWKLLGRVCWEVFPQFRDHEASVMFCAAMYEREFKAWESLSVVNGLWNRFRAYPMPDGGVSLFVENIDNRVRAEQAQQASELRFRTLADLVPAFICTMNVEGRVEWRNQRWLTYSGLTATSSANEALQVVHPDDREQSFRLFRAAIASGSSFQLEQRLRRADGEYRWFLLLAQPVRDAAGSVYQWVGAAVDVQDQVHQREHIRALRDEAEAARAQLEQAHAQLERRIAERTAQLALSNAALAAEIDVRVRAEAARSDLLRRLASAREDEQRRTARDLHDQVGQTLSALMLAIKIACDADVLPPTAAARLVDALRLAEDLGRDIHDLATRLRPAALDDIGLYAALRQLVGNSERRSGAVFDFQAAWLQRERLPAEVETILYRVVQEALTNVVRHARATHVSVVVEHHDGQAIAVVEDDGVGFDVTATAHGRLGLIGMQERITLAGGTLDLESSTAGTTVIARVPVLLTSSSQQQAHHE